VKLSLEERLRPHPDVVDTDLDDGETALLHLETRTYFSLNATGSRIWQSLKEGLSLQEVSRRLQREFRIDADGANESVLRLAEELAAAKLVQPTEETR
jgi:hypothetical protein